ncbi:radical SAM family heme chaperone HemW [Alteribacillus bidgolensis]|uniref:Heme chaperone HemW n=1 Tax=Alteribacillus bidgolensis TaxID=930129 RepID=A0A1G8NYG8_9BACI|nr:radical SAM family heme chaperone HemW [Alteribacillus bidgolensis]SDI85302.1 oxygen-independent coproporphyrinogen-3 oxidase [Alteribacillus bidgolensis]
MAPSAIYVHIPFCKQICFYCDFNKFYLENQPVNDYVDALGKEIRDAFSINQAQSISSVYIGGGTPTALNNDELEKVILDIKSNAPLLDNELEFTVEVNPGEAGLDKLKLMKSLGVNRLSIGVQSFDNSLLKKIGRSHSVKEALKTIELARKAGFENISIDLMFGLPGQTIQMWQETITTMLELNIPHVSAYSLKIEEKTMFYNWYRQGKLQAIPEDKEAQMYEELVSRLHAYGYETYEISNFAQKGFESRHNQVYWENKEYFGFGAGAHGYVNGHRYANIGPLTHYIKALQQGESVVKETHEVTTQEMMEEEMFMGLRMKKGVKEEIFKKKYGSSYLDVFQEAIQDLQHKELLKDTGGSLHLTKKGRLLGNEVFERFLLE